MAHPLFQHRHYVRIASALQRVVHRTQSPVERGVVVHVVRELADELAQDNPAFDRMRFTNAVDGMPTPKDARGMRPR